MGAKAAPRLTCGRSSEARRGSSAAFRALPPEEEDEGEEESEEGSEEESEEEQKSEEGERSSSRFLP